MLSYILTIQFPPFFMFICGVYLSKIYGRSTRNNNRGVVAKQLSTAADLILGFPSSVLHCIVITTINEVKMLIPSLFVALYATKI